MLEGFLNFWKNELKIKPQNKVLLTVSGGVDSMVMWDLFEKASLDFGIAHCNFQLRGQDANQDEQFVIAKAQLTHVNCHHIRFQTQDFAAQKGISIQMAARELRYDWFERLRQEFGCQYIATAHHQDDVVETFLLHLLRKTGISGLHSIRPQNGHIIRPLLFADKEKILNYASKNKVVYREDCSNKDDHYLRNYIRLHIVPHFKTIEPNFSRTLQESIAVIARQEEIYYQHIDAISRQILHACDGYFFINIQDLKPLSNLSTYLFEFLKPFGFNAAQVDNICRLLDSPEEKVFTTIAYQLRKTRERIEIYPSNEPQPPLVLPRIHIDAEGECLFGNQIITFQPQPYQQEASLVKTLDTAYFDYDKILFPLCLRGWEKGDAFYPFGGKGRKKLSDFFTDSKLTLTQKTRIPILCDANNNILWVVGLRSDNRFRLTPNTKTMLVCKTVKR